MSGSLKADLIILIIFGLSIGLSFLRGFVKELISLLSWIMAIWLAILYCHDLSVLMTFTQLEWLRVGVAFLAIFVPTVFFGAVINMAITRIVRKTPFSLPDRILGMIFGFCKAGLLLSLLVLFGGFTELPQSSWWQQSNLLKPLEFSANMIKSYLPQDLLTKQPKTAKN